MRQQQGVLILLQHAERGGSEEVLVVPVFVLAAFLVHLRVTFRTRMSHPVPPSSGLS